MFGIGKKKKESAPQTSENTKAEKAVKVKKTKEKKKAAPQEPQYYRSVANTQTLNYRVYYMSKAEKALYTFLFMAAGMIVGLIVFGGMAKDEFGAPTITTYCLDAVFMLLTGLAGVKIFVPVRTRQLLEKRKETLKKQFRDFLEDLSTSLGAGNNIENALKAAEADLKNQYEEGAFIVNEVSTINAGIRNGATAEDMIEDFAKRSGCSEIEDFSNTFSVCFRKGSNIRDVVRNTNEILSDKMNVKQEIETMVTSSKLELNLILLMPVGMILMMKLISPDFAANFATPSGLISLLISLACCVVSYMMGRKILDFNI